MLQSQHLIIPHCHRWKRGIKTSSPHHSLNNSLGSHIVAGGLVSYVAVSVPQHFVQYVAELPAEDGAAVQREAQRVGPEGVGSLLPVSPQDDSCCSVVQEAQTGGVFWWSPMSKMKAMLMGFSSISIPSLCGMLLFYTSELWLLLFDPTFQSPSQTGNMSNSRIFQNCCFMVT